MKYICLVYHEEKNLQDLPEGEMETVLRDCTDWVGELDRGHRHIVSAGLQAVSTAMTLRYRNGKMLITDGPFAETKEQLGGFTLLEARDLNEAIHLAEGLAAANGASIEVRPVLEPDASLTDPLDRKAGAVIRRMMQDAS
jgi:hypothetical protein